MCGDVRNTCGFWLYEGRRESEEERKKGRRERKEEDVTREKTGRGREVCGPERGSVTEMNRI